MAATTKTLIPTNQTISIPAFTDKPDNRLQTDSTGKLADAVNALSEQIANKTGSCTTSYGSISYRRTGNVVMLVIAVSNVSGGTTNWTTISTDIPSIIAGTVFTGVSSNGRDFCAFYITQKTIQIFGSENATCSITYITSE